MTEEGWVINISPGEDGFLAVLIDVGDNVDINNTSVLRAFTTYSITVVPFSNVWGESVGSQTCNYTTPQKSKKLSLCKFKYANFLH